VISVSAGANGSNTHGYVAQALSAPVLAQSGLAASTSSSTAATESKEAEAEVTPYEAERLLQLQAWHRELKMLSDMGFPDDSVTLPLVQQHMRVPTAEGEEGITNTAGLHSVLAALLSGVGSSRSY
jgi:hypothetical protein